MAKKKSKDLKITKEDLLKLEAQVRREQDIADGIKPPASHIHTSKKQYSRKDGKNKPKDLED